MSAKQVKPTRRSRGIAAPANSLGIVAGLLEDDRLVEVETEAHAVDLVDN